MSMDREEADLSQGLENVPVSVLGRPPEFQYSPDNVAGPGCTVDPSEVTLPGCSCRSRSCFPDSCSCLQTRGQTYDGSGALLQLRAASALCRPVFECNALCLCSEACGNRVVQGGLRRRLQVFSTENRGWGVRTLEAIPRGAFVCEYAGEVLGAGEARRRQLSQTPDDNNYIIAVREHAGSGPVTETFVDPAVVGNVGRFLNHSCRPNLLMLPVRAHSAVPRLALFAGRGVAAHEELTFDYSGGNSEPCTQADTQVSTHGDTHADTQTATQARTDALRRKECHCGADCCAKVLPLDLSIFN